VLAQGGALVAAGLGIGLLLMVTLGPTGSGEPGPSPLASGLVAWVNSPAPSPTPTPKPTFGTAPACVTGRLGSVSRGHRQLAAGNVNVEVRIKNLSNASCTLRGYPQVSGVTSAGQVVPLSAKHGSSLGNPGPVAPIPPGKVVAVNVSTSNGCGTSLEYPTLRLTIPTGEAFDVPGGSWDVGCGVTVSRFGVPSLAPKPEPVSPLRVTMAAPQTTKAGETLVFTVTITNTGRDPYLFTPCPSYREYVEVGSGTTTTTTERFYYLNCSAASMIDPGRSLTFSMELPVGTATGAGKLGWTLLAPGSPGATTTIEAVAGT
jgi:hypothetical protein